MNDLRFALRQLRRNPVFTAVVLLTLALGIGANSALFSVVYAVLIKPLPYREPGRLVQVQSSVTVPGKPVQTWAFWSFPKFEVLRDHNRLFAQVAACASDDVTVTGDGGAERIRAEAVSSTYFPLLGLQPSLGRVFGSEEDRAPGSAAVVLIGDGLWRRRFGGDPNVIGKTLHADRVSLTVIGVLPPGFTGQSGSAELWVPISLVPVLQRDPTRLQRPWVMWHQVLARLNPGLNLAQAQPGLAELERQIETAYPEPADAGQATWRIQLVPLQTALTDPVIRRSLWVLLAAVGFVLLIACVNVAHLLLTRAVSREGEMAIRLALGASRGHLVRHFLLESLVLAVIAGALALLLARWGTDLLAAFQPADQVSHFVTHARLPEFGAIQLDVPVLAFNFLSALGCGVGFGLFAAWRAARQPPGLGLRRSAERATPGGGVSRHMGGRGLLVTAETALALVLMVGAGLMLRSFNRLTETPIGFDPEHLLTFRLDRPSGTAPEESARFYQQVLERVAALPGVESVCLADATPLSGTFDRSVALPKGPVAADGGVEMPVGIHQVNADYLRTLRVPLLRGRWFTEQDRRGSGLVTVINQTMASRYWPDRDPVGQELDLSQALGPDYPSVEIVGVVGDVKYDDLAAEIGADLYLSYLQCGYPGYYVSVRTGKDPLSIVGAVRQTVAALNADVPLYDLLTMRQRLANSASRLEFNTLLLVLFALLALGLSVTGLYGLVAHSVAQRTREIGIRMALGAPAKGVVDLIVWQAMRMVLLGGLVGLGFALALTRFLGSLLYEVEATDPLTSAGVLLVLALAAFLASYLPARRAASVDPMVALRAE
jgi:putative ABC transport system permease protein